MVLQGTVPPKILILQLFTHQHAVPILYDLVFFCGTQNIFAKYQYPGHSFAYNESRGTGDVKK